MCNKADNSCRQEKLGCKGCFYNKNDDIDDIEFIKYFIGDLRILNSVIPTLNPLNVKLEKSLINIINQIEELKAITNRYDAICKTDTDYILIANKSYFDNGIFKNNLIHISKIIDLKRYYEEQAEETEKAYGKLRNISNLYRIYR